MNSAAFAETAKSGELGGLIRSAAFTADVEIADAVIQTSI